jgi:tetratricopeptide (TPR) repeat protein
MAGVFSLLCPSCPAADGAEAPERLGEAVATVAEPVADATAMDLVRLAKETRPAVMLLMALDETGKEIGNGTGFVVSSDGKLITNRHVVERAAAAFARAANGERYAVIGVLAESETNDLAVLQLAGDDFPFLSLGSAEHIEAGMRIAVIGSPLGLEGSLSEGIVSAMRDAEPGVQWLQITAPISPGSSGSPVLDARGEVIGVATARSREGQAINFAVSADAAQSLLERAERALSPQPLSLLARSARGHLKEDAQYHAYLELFINNELDRALEVLQALVKRYPNRAEGHRELGDVYWSMRRYADSIAAYRQAVKLKPEFVEAWRELGESYEELLMYADAEQAYREAIRLKPEHADTWRNLGGVLNEQGKHFEAIGAYRKAVQLDAADHKSWRDLGQAYHSLGKYGDAVLALQHALNLEPGDALTLYRLGLAYNGQARFADEIQAYERAVRIWPNFADAWHNLAAAYIKARQHEKAWQAVRKLEELDARRAAKLTKVLLSLPQRASQLRPDNP